MQIKPLQDRVVVKMIENEEKTIGGLFLPDNAKEKPQIAEVIAIGPGSFQNGQEVKMYLAVKDKVLLNKYAGTAVKVDGEEYIIVRQDDVLAIVE